MYRNQIEFEQDSVSRSVTVSGMTDDSTSGRQWREEITRTSSYPAIQASHIDTCSLLHLLLLSRLRTAIHTGSIRNDRDYKNDLAIQHAERSDVYVLPADAGQGIYRKLDDIPLDFWEMQKAHSRMAISFRITAQVE